MDALTQILMERQMSPPGQPQAGGPPPQGGLPPPPGPPPQLPPPPTPQDGVSVPPVLPNPTAKLPQQDQRFEHAQQLMESYRNGWSPNPMLLRAEQTK